MAINLTGAQLGSVNLSDLRDVSIVSPAASDYLRYNDVPGEWQNSTINSDVFSFLSTSLTSSSGIVITFLSGTETIDISGTTGTQGATGAQGTTGTQGLTGDQGIQGIQGITGTQGVSGLLGLQGAIGTQGATGTNGENGIGVQGITGIGVQGTAGSAGTNGIQGLQGVQGITGSPAGGGTTGQIYISGGGSPPTWSGVVIDANNTISGHKEKIKYLGGTTYTLDPTDTGLIIDHSSPTTATVTLPNSLPPGYALKYMQTGAGQIIFSLESGATLENRNSHSATAGQWASVNLVVRLNVDNLSAEYVLTGDTGV